jgi:hypothetical protein
VRVAKKSLVACVACVLACVAALPLAAIGQTAPGTPAATTSTSDLATVAPFFAAGLAALGGALGAFIAKELLDRKRLGVKEYQTRWRPLAISADHLNSRLTTLASDYRHTSHDYQWYNYTWTDLNGQILPIPLAAKDFHELFLIEADPPLLDQNFGNLGDAASSHRKDPQAIQRVRERIHELNAATISLYRTAVYLGYAQRVLQELQLDKLDISDTTRRQLVMLLLEVRFKLNGPSGSGIIDDLQDLIGQSVWTGDDTVISYHEFRELILSEKGWEQFIELFRFFAHFHFKINSEVKDTANALVHLSGALAQIGEPRQRKWFGRLLS